MQSQGLHGLDQPVHGVLGHVQHQHLLVRGQADALGTGGLGGVGQGHERVPGEPARGEREAHVPVAVHLLVHAHVVRVAHRALGGGAVRQLEAQVLVLQHLPEL